MEAQPQPNPLGKHIKNSVSRIVSPFHYNDTHLLKNCDFFIYYIHDNVDRRLLCKISDVMEFLD